MLAHFIHDRLSSTMDCILTNFTFNKGFHEHIVTPIFIVRNASSLFSSARFCLYLVLSAKLSIFFYVFVIFAFVFPSKWHSLPVFSRSNCRIFCFFFLYLISLLPCLCEPIQSSQMYWLWKCWKTYDKASPKLIHPLPTLSTQINLYTNIACVYVFLSINVCKNKIATQIGESKTK